MLNDLLKFSPGQYCIECQSSNVRECVNNKNQVFYYCSDCKNKGSRVLEIDPKVKLEKIKQGWKHFTAGALIVDDFENPKKYLIIKKRKHPYLYDVVAGHIEKGENEEEALAREVKEEAGAEIKKKKLLLNIVINPDPCRRGIDVHEWFLYLCSLKNDFAASKDEVADTRWYSRKELQNLDFVIPTEKMFKNLKLIK